VRPFRRARRFAPSKPHSTFRFVNCTDSHGTLIQGPHCGSDPEEVKCCITNALVSSPAPSPHEFFEGDPCTSPGEGSGFCVAERELSDQCHAYTNSCSNPLFVLKCCLTQHSSPSPSSPSPTSSPTPTLTPTPTPSPTPTPTPSPSLTPSPTPDQSDFFVGSDCSVPGEGSGACTHAGDPDCWTKSQNMDACGGTLTGLRCCIFIPNEPSPSTTPTTSPSPSGRVDCLVESWSVWSTLLLTVASVLFPSSSTAHISLADCSKPCGGGYQNRSRAVLRYPSGGGEACPLIRMAQLCNTNLCTRFY